MCEQYHGGPNGRQVSRFAIPASIQAFMAWVNAGVSVLGRAKTPGAHPLVEFRAHFFPAFRGRMCLRLEGVMKARDYSVGGSSGTVSRRVGSDSILRQFSGTVSRRVASFQMSCWFSGRCAFQRASQAGQASPVLCMPGNASSAKARTSITTAFMELPPHVAASNTHDEALRFRKISDFPRHFLPATCA